MTVPEVSQFAVVPVFFYSTPKKAMIFMCIIFNYKSTGCVFLLRWKKMGGVVNANYLDID